MSKNNEAIKTLSDALLTIGRSLPVGMVVWFGRDDGDPRAKMEVGEPSGKVTTYAFVKSNPLPVVPLSTLLREQKLEQGLRDLLSAIYANTDDVSSCSPVLHRAVDTAEALLADGWEPDEDHPANWATSQPASVSYPTGSLGEAVDDQGWLS